MDSEGFFSRHTIRISDPLSGKTIRPESEYAGISPEGVELARKQALEIKEMIDSAAPRSVLLIGGSSEEPRTKSTAEVYGEELAHLYAKSEEVLVLKKSDIDLLHTAEGDDSNTVRELQAILNSNPEKKIVLTYPLYIKEFSLRPEIRKKGTGEPTDFTRTIIEQASSEEAGANAFMSSGGKVTDNGAEFEGISAQEAALKQLKGMDRLSNFAKRYAGDRPVLVGYVSHGWILDAIAAYLANEGVAGEESFKKTGGKMIDNAEIGKLKIQDGVMTFTYRGKSHAVPANVLEGNP